MKPRYVHVDLVLQLYAIEEGATEDGIQEEVEDFLKGYMGLKERASYGGMCSIRIVGTKTLWEAPKEAPR